MRNACRLLIAVVFAVQTLTAPFWILCHSTGPDAHDRVELVFASCCSCCEEKARAPSCALDAQDCDACHDEKLEQPGVLRPVQNLPLALACAALPAPVTEAIAFRMDPQGIVLLQHHPGDPPLFLTHCNFRI